MEQKFENWEDYKGQILDGLDEKTSRMVGRLVENVHEDNVQTIGDPAHANRILVESTAPGSTVTSNISRYDMIFAPLVRRVMPSLLAMNLVGVQPLPGPRGIVRTIRHRYSQTTAAGGPTAGDEASGVNVFDKYSLLALGDDYDAVDLLDPFAQTVHLEGNRGKPMDLEVVTDSVEPKSRKLSAAWSLETDDDLQALDGLDTETELNNSLSDQIMRDIDRELITDLTALAGTVQAFDFTNVDGRYAGEKLAGLMIAFDNLSAQIAMKTKLTGATWMVISQSLFTAMKNASNSSFIPANDGDIRLSSSLFVGTWGRVAVYVDPYASGDTVLMGRKGSSELDAGFWYLPYIPLQSSGAVRNPETGDHRIMLRTRYATYKATDTDKTLGDSPDHYARLTVSNLQLGFKN